MSTPPVQGLMSFQSVENLMLNMTSGGIFEVSPELAGALGRQQWVREAADGNGRVFHEAAANTLKMNDNGRWIGDSRGVPPITAASRTRAETRTTENKNRAFCVTHTPPTPRVQRGVQRSASMMVAGIVGHNEGKQHHKPRIGDGRHLPSQPQGMRRCISEPTSGHQRPSQNNPTSLKVTEHEAKPASSGPNYEWNRSQVPLEDNYEYRQKQPQQWQRPISAPIQQHTPKFPSASNLCVPHQQQRFPGSVTGPRKSNSKVNINEKDAGSSGSHGSQAGFVATQKNPRTGSDGSVKDLNYGFPMQYTHPTENRRHFSSMNDLRNATNSNRVEHPPKESSLRNLFVSKRFGSASELIQKIFKKKSNVGEAEVSDGSSGISNHLSGSTPHLPFRDVQAHPEPPQDVAKRTPPNAITNDVKRTHREKISPPYPPPLRATHSYCNIGSSQDTSNGRTSDFNPQTMGLHSASSSDVRSSHGGERSEGSGKMTRSDSSSSKVFCMACQKQKKITNPYNFNH